ncbi:hypothetical protein C2G38_2176005 [Gigaspora rosea]|uniref:Uncharacterized protein n=1 Tax=Gigaspora rosea TaxID=44941 RepID=A0A397VGP3_9GLOM|nr:hypothetical protein C2G38_2176005 [Gigaspora rosea]
MNSNSDERDSTPVTTSNERTLKWMTPSREQLELKKSTTSLKNEELNSSANDKLKENIEIDEKDYQNAVTGKDSPNITGYSAYSLKIEFAKF